MKLEFGTKTTREIPWDTTQTLRWCARYFAGDLGLPTDWSVDSYDAHLGGTPLDWDKTPASQGVHNGDTVTISTRSGETF